MSSEAEPFDRFASSYDAAVEAGVRLSGETRQFFSSGRVKQLALDLRRLGALDGVRRILDFGCGTGSTSVDLFESFPCIEVVGVDPSSAMIDEARRRVSRPGVRFEQLRALRDSAPAFDLVYAANVFHHIAPVERQAVLAQIGESLREGGHLALFENNPWNPGARAVMARVSFDLDAVPLSVREAKRRLLACGLRPVRVRSLFYFPRMLAKLRVFEPALAALPLGAQYLVIARKPLAFQGFP